MRTKMLKLQTIVDATLAEVNSRGEPHIKRMIPAMLNLQQQFTDFSLLTEHQMTQYCKVLIKFQQSKMDYKAHSKLVRSCFNLGIRSFGE